MKLTLSESTSLFFQSLLTSADRLERNMQHGEHGEQVDENMQHGEHPDENMRPQPQAHHRNVQHQDDAESIDDAVVADVADEATFIRYLRR